MKTLLKKRPSLRSLRAIELAELRARLDEAEETLRAIRSGEVDALIVTGQQGDQVFTLEGAGHAYRLLIESMNEGALTLTAEGIILYANQHFAKMVKCPLEEVIGRSFDRFLSSETGATLRALLKQDENGGTQIQVLLNGGDASQTPAQISISPWTKNGISPFIIGVVVSDLTEARRIADHRETERLYAQVREQAIELEKRVKERTRQLQEANLELEAFESSVSHDLRSPLRYISGFSHMLIEGYAAQLPEDARCYLKKIADGVTKMDGLVLALLELSRLSKCSISLQPVDLAQMCREIISEMNPDLRDRRIDFTIGDLPFCLGDPRLLRQVLINLLGNAIKYSRTRDRSFIEVSALPRSASNGTVYYIKDNGVGFDMKYAGKLFTVFHRLHDAQEFEGTGVGLTTVKRIIQRHGGRIWAESALNAGATFFFTVGASSVG